MDRITRAASSTGRRAKSDFLSVISYQYYLLQDDRYKVMSLLTTCNEHFQRVSMHGVRLELLEKQAQAIGLPLQKMFVSQRSSNEEYLQKLNERLLAYKAQGITSFAFGDIFLEDLKRWREDNLAKLGLRGVFPIWKRDSGELIGEFIALGFGSVICCVNDAFLNERWLGRNIDADFVNGLPPDVDPCGENGEFHSFAFAGPILKEPLQIKVGGTVYRPVEQTHPGSSTGPAICPPAGARQTKDERILVLRPSACVSVASPCIHLCKLNEHGFCVGCFRTIQEIAGWTCMTESQKRRVVAGLAQRSQTCKFDGTEGLNE